MVKFEFVSIQMVANAVIFNVLTVSIVNLNILQVLLYILKTTGENLSENLWKL